MQYIPFIISFVSIADIFLNSDLSFIPTQIEEIKKNDPDLVILDIMLPDVEGQTIYSEIRSDGRFRDIPVVFSSAKCTEDAFYSEYKGGHQPNAFLDKPFKSAELIDVVKGFLE